MSPAENKRKLIRDPMYAELAALTLPIFLQNILSACVNSADVLMLNVIGQDPLSAVSLAANYASILNIVFFGITTGVTVMAAQYFGKKDMKTVHLVEGIAFRFSLPLSFFFAVLSLTVPKLLMRIFTPDETIIGLGASYLRWIGISFIFMGFTYVYEAVLRCCGHVKTATALNVTAFTLNIILNALFIFVIFKDSPERAAEGVGMATAIARGTSFVLGLLYSFKSKDVKYSFTAVFSKQTVLFGDFMNLAVPAMVNDLVWILGFSMYSVIFGHLGSDVVAANSVANVVRNFATVAGYAVGSASGILLGNILGTDDMVKAEECGSKCLKASIVFSIIGGVIIAAAIPFVLVMEKGMLTAQAYSYLKVMLLISIYYISGGIINTMLIAGVFRAGGDAKFGMYCDAIDMWVYAVPLGLIAAFVLKLPPMWVYFLVFTDEFVKWPWVFRRYRQKKWLKNITRELGDNRQTEEKS